MKTLTVWLALAAFVSTPALAQTTVVNPAAVAKIGGIPQFLVDPEVATGQRVQRFRWIDLQN